MKYKNIIFDLGGILFDYNRADLYNAMLYPEINPFKAIEPSHKLLQKLYDKRDSNGQRVHQLFVLSNWSKDSFNLLKNHYGEVFKKFNGVVISSDVGFKKPDRRMYQYILDKYSLNSHESIFIDDQNENIIAAQKFGIYGIHCDKHTIEERIKPYLE